MSIFRFGILRIVLAMAVTFYALISTMVEDVKLYAQNRAADGSVVLKVDGSKNSDWAMQSLRVEECLESGKIPAKMWVIGPKEGGAHPFREGKIRYGSLPGEFEEVSSPRALERGHCYMMTVIGSNTLDAVGFEVDKHGVVHSDR